MCQVRKATLQLSVTVCLSVVVSGLLFGDASRGPYHLKLTNKAGQMVVSNSFESLPYRTQLVSLKQPCVGIGDTGRGGFLGRPTAFVQRSNAKVAAPLLLMACNTPDPKQGQINCQTCGTRKRFAALGSCNEYSCNHWHCQDHTSGCCVNCSSNSYPCEGCMSPAGCK
jgi:hypothetical protein